MDRTFDSRDKIEELVEILNKASRAYYDENNEIMSNLEYDALYDELDLLEKKTGIILDNSPTGNVGYAVQSELPKEKHMQKMLSLDKTKEVDELSAWLGEREALISWKLDGLTVVLTYEEGKLTKAVTRGNGVIGEVITENARTFVNLPKTVPYDGRLVVRGEAVIRYSDFNRINDTIDDVDSKYKNPRNLCSGSVRQLDSRVTAERSVNLFVFSLYESDRSFTTRHDQMEWMKELGFDVVEYTKVDNDFELRSAIEYYAGAISNFDVPSDGLVLTFDDLEYSASLGSTAKFPRDSIAFKWRDQQAQTVLKEIEWSVSRTGLLNPVAVFDPVELEGTTVNRASVHNLSIIESLELGIGDIITVYKANMIIPQIADNITRSGNLSLPSECPSCGGDTLVEDTGGTKVLRCFNLQCPAKHRKKFELFVSRDALNVEGLSEARLGKLIEKGYVRSFVDIFKLKKYEDEIKNLEGFGQKSVDRLIASIDKARNTTPERILIGLGIPGVGTVTASAIARSRQNKWNDILSLTGEDLKEIDGIGEVIATDWDDFMNSENRAMIEELVAELNIDENFEERGGLLDGKGFVITGTLNHFTNRKALKDAIEARGGKVMSSVTSATDYLITNDTTSGSAKNKKAAELGIAVITEDEIIAMLGM